MEIKMTVENMFNMEKWMDVGCKGDVEWKVDGTRIHDLKEKVDRGRTDAEVTLCTTD